MVESSNGRLRDECLNAHAFDSIDDMRATLNEWQDDYNRRRPHGSLGHLTPVSKHDEVRNRAAKRQNSSSSCYEDRTKLKTVTTLNPSATKRRGDVASGVIWQELGYEWVSV